jgi:hypothetical protein
MTLLVRRQALSSGCLPVFLRSSCISYIRLSSILRGSSNGRILVLLVPVVSKSLFILLSLVTLLTAGASLQSGAPRPEGDDATAGVELRADVASLKADASTVYDTVHNASRELHAFREEFSASWRDLKADASAEYHDAARYLGSFVKTSSRPLS